MSARVISETRLPGADFERIPDLAVVPDLLSLEPSEEARALIVAHGRVDGSLLDRFPRLAVVARYGIGYDSVDVEACTARGVQVAITPGPVERATAELTLALIFAAQWELPRWSASARAGGWGAPLGDTPTAPGLWGTRLGLIGLGRVGWQVAQRGTALGMEVSYYSRSRHPDAETAGVVWRDLDELAATSDVLSVHVPLTESTRGLVDARLLARMPAGSLLVNTARGPIVDETALVAEVRTSRLRAALDAFWNEPEIPEELRALDSVLLTPHIGSQVRGVRVEMTRLVVENVIAGLEGRAVPHGVPEQSDLRAAIGSL